MMPLTGVILAARWNFSTEFFVSCPKFPSTLVGIPTSFSQVWAVRTSEPWSPIRRTRLKGGALELARAGAVNVSSGSSSRVAKTARQARRERLSGVCVEVSSTKVRWDMPMCQCLRG